MRFVSASGQWKKQQMLILTGLEIHFEEVGHTPLKKTYCSKYLKSCRQSGRDILARIFADIICTEVAD